MSIQERDEKILKKVKNIAETAASIFNYTYSGVDIIRDKKTGEYYFLEINSAPQWNNVFGFSRVVRVNVAEKLIDLCVQLAKRSNTSPLETIKNYYKDNINLIPEKKIHFFSRLWLWTREKSIRKILQEEKSNYLGKNNTCLAMKLREHLQKNNRAKKTDIELRREYFAKYERLISYNKVLFKVLFAQTLYGENIKPIVKKLGIDKEMLLMYQKLKKDKKAICVLSTHAINFMYMLRNYFERRKEYENKIKINPKQFIRLLDEFDSILAGQVSKKQALLLKIYLLTHAIIGESRFYSRVVNDPRYNEMIRRMEEIIRRNYFDVNLDNKFEFLVCAKICNYFTDLDLIIYSEANSSFSSNGNYLIDRHNNFNQLKYKDNLSSSEHRNVLFIMAYSDFKLSNNNTKIFNKKNTKFIIGKKALISFPKLKLFDLPAKVDTGAIYSAIHCNKIKILKTRNGKKLELTLLDDKHEGYKGGKVILNDFEQINIRSSFGEVESRYLVRLDVKLGSKIYKRQKFTLSDRSNMLYPVLIGRKLLRGRYVVDIAKEGIDEG